MKHHCVRVLQFSDEMNLCRLFLQCGVEACFYHENNEVRTMGASLSNEIPINPDSITFSDQFSMQGVVR